ncbi:hypothetical protein GF359_05235, partial [candidate division WOR-3 bacterium]|nr:hypothetical protein [candidate division WOR-3 bacterium]MBD3364599.1 hypothetical protein [candidate division WOR-3 bacterium]
MISSVYMAVVSILFSVNIEFDQDIFVLMNRVDTDTILQTISDISGEQAVTIGGVPDSIPCRYAITEGAHKAARWLAEQLEAEGIQAEVVGFEVDPSSIGQELPIGTTAEELKTVFNPSISATKPYTMWNVVGTLPGDDSLEVLLT